MPIVFAMLCAPLGQDLSLLGADLSAFPAIIAANSALWAEPELIGRTSMWRVTWVYGRSVLANGHGGEAP
jgi:hypothetical protein